MKNDTLRTIVMMGALLSTTISAQEPRDVIMFTSMQEAPVPPPAMWEQPFGLVAIEPFDMGGPVENAPYSAEIVTEVIQEFADGNRIERRTTSTVARDARGRVRREQQLTAIGPVLPEGDVRMVTINDPVARVHYSLDPVRKAAIRSGRPGPPHAPGRPALPPTMPTQVVGAESAATFEQHVAVPPPQDVRAEKLGSKDIEGVAAEGSRTTMAIPAGAIGNVRPIEITSERWYSPELRVVVYSRRSDPRFGDTTYRLTNIVRAEPDPALFQVPPDYKTEEMKLPPFKQMKGKLRFKSGG